MQKLNQLWNRLPVNFRHVIHTAWQIALPTFVAHLYLAKSSKDVQAAFIATGAVFLASLKASLLTKAS